jgi:hypothetical protein
MALVFVAALHYEKSIPPLGFVRAFAEAAMVGALADWFAVTALFRHPLGIPIPHTAIIPRNKDRIGENMGRFVEQNFLAPALVAERSRTSISPARLARWLAEPAQGAWIAGGIASMLPRILHALDDSDLRRFAGEHLVAGVRKIDFATIAARMLELHDARQPASRDRDAADRPGERAARRVQAADPRAHPQGSVVGPAHGLLDECCITGSSTRSSASSRSCATRRRTRCARASTRASSA